MGYEVALKKAWDVVRELDIKDRYVQFFKDNYEIDYDNRNIISMSCNVSAKEYYRLLILHYLAGQNKVLNITNNKWISFKELDGGEAYFPAFKKRAMDPILKKYGNDPSCIFKCAESLGAEKLDMGSFAVLINAFPKIKVAVILWAKDDEFQAECSMLFNQEIKDIFPTEDVAVLGGILAYLL